MPSKLILDESEAVDSEEVEVVDAEKETAKETEQNVEVVSKDETEEPEKVPEKVEVEKEFGDDVNNNYLQQTLIDLIKSEWDAYQQYKNAMSSFKELTFNKSLGVDLGGVANILTDIANEELIHVGQLQKALDMFQKNLTKQLASGNSEADEQIGEEKVEK